MSTKENTAANTLRQTVVGLKEDAEVMANQAGHKVREIYDTTTHGARDASAAVEKQIRRNPVAAAATALGLGVLLGMLFRRR